MKIKLNTPIEEAQTSVIELAKSLAQADNTEQAKFLNAFSAALLASCGDKHHKELQICDMGDHLDNNGIKLIEDLFGFIELKINKSE